MEGREADVLFLRHRARSSLASRITLCRKIPFIRGIRKDRKIRTIFRTTSSRPQDLRSLCDHFDLISNYKSQSYPIVATDHATIPENIDDERGLRSSNKERERERTFLGGGRSPHCNRALAAGGYFRMQTDFEFTVGRNSMGAPPKGIPTYLLEAPDLPSASCLCLRRKRYFFGYHPVENCASPLA